MFLLDKTIKLWKVHDKTIKVVAETNNAATNFAPISREALRYYMIA